MVRSGAREDQSCTQPFHARALGRRDGGRHDGRGRHAEELCGDRHRLRVIAGGRRDHPARTHRGIEPREIGVGPAELEDAPTLQRLGFEPEAHAELVRAERAGGEERRAHRYAPKCLGGGAQLGERDEKSLRRTGGGHVGRERDGERCEGCNVVAGPAAWPRDLGRRGPAATSGPPSCTRLVSPGGPHRDRGSSPAVCPAA